ncbi:MAG: nicotinate-nucleotide adenylyltransferase [Cetobacterium sp.]
MKIGIYGGSFNPIHNGHIYIARFILENLELDKLFIIPVGEPSHRENILLDGKLRLKMCEIAFEGDKKIEVSDIEINSKEVSYTYDTLLKIIEKYPKSEYFEIIGEDSSAYFHKWKNYKEILKIAKVVVLKREGYRTELRDKNLIQLESLLLNYSSTKVRAAILQGEKLDSMLPEKVIQFIENNKLYR